MKRSDKLRMLNSISTHTINPEPNKMVVMRKRCSECLFSSAKLVNDAKVQIILDACNRTGEAFECHEATLGRFQGGCRAFYDGNMSLVVRLAKLLKVETVFVEVPGEGTTNRKQSIVIPALPAVHTSDSDSS